MSSNKNARLELERLYGRECFIDKLHLRKDKRKKYTGKAQYKKMKQLTYHHIKMRKDGGKTTIENGALLSVENHSWFHRQPPEAQAAMNRAFQQYKISVATLNSRGIQSVQKLEIDTSDCITIPLEENEIKKINRETNKTRRAREKQALKQELEDLEYE